MTPIKRDPLILSNWHQYVQKTGCGGVKNNEQMLNVVNRKEEYIYSRASLSICSSPTFFSLKELDRYTHHHNLIRIQANEHKLD